MTDPEWNAFTYAYGANGRISRILNKRNLAILENEYDDYRRVVLQRFTDDGELWFDYRNKNGNETVHSYDEKGRLTEIRSFDGSRIEYRCDGMGPPDNDTGRWKDLCFLCI